jgi:hypothetical protein
MRKRKVNLLQVFALVLGLLLPLVGCQEGPAERAGQQLGNAAREVRDTVNPPSGPAEAAGRKIDDVTRRSPGRASGNGWPARHLRRLWRVEGWHQHHLGCLTLETSGCTQSLG